MKKNLIERGGKGGKEPERELPTPSCKQLSLLPQLKFTADFTARLTFCMQLTICKLWDAVNKPDAGQD